MTHRLGTLLAVVVAATLATAACGQINTVEDLQQQFDQPPDNARVMTRWWWYGPAVTKGQLENDLKFMKEGGFGGAEVQTTYALALDDQVPGLKNYKFLSPEHLEAYNFAASKAKELGLRLDLTLGSGWPYGGPMFTPEENAGRLRTSNVTAAAGQRTVPVPAPGRGESLAAAVGVPLRNGQADLTAAKVLTVADNMAQIPSELGDGAQVYFYFNGHTGMQVKRPAVGAEGNVIDHYDPAVINKFIKEIADVQLKAFGSNVPYAVFCDSLEVAGEDWTPTFLAEFKKRRGYDLTPYLPALFDNNAPKALDIRHDWGQTITEIFTDNFVKHFTDWAHANGTKFRLQGYGTPPSALYTYIYADLPEGEGYQWHGYRASRWASSANHLLGNPVTSSETWTWLHSPVFRATPLDMKSEADLHFLQGVNQLIAHGWPDTAEGIEYPGWRFYAAAVFNEKNPWWIVMPDITKYLQRCSFLLRQGQPANDIALYLSNSDAWAAFQPGRVSLSDGVRDRMGPRIIPAILDSGYNLDMWDDGMLDLKGKVDGGALAFGDVRYKVVVLPLVTRMPLPTLRKLETFAKNGGTIIAIRDIPSVAPGLKASDADQKEEQDIAARIFKGPNAPGIVIENEGQFAAALAKKLAPDVAISPAEPDVAAVHRHSNLGEVYFVANTSNTAKNVKATFRVEGMQAEWWDPMTGRVSPATISAKPAGGTTLDLNLEPYGSTIVVFTKRTLPAAPAASAIAAVPAAIDLSAGWTVTLGKDGKPMTMAALKSWADVDANKFYSGVATYEKTITVPDTYIKNGLSVRLDFGQSTIPADGGGRGAEGYRVALDPPIREAAIIYVNGQRVGSLWHPPYFIDVTSQLKVGENKIRVEVANTAVNFMAGHPLPDYTALSAKYTKRFDAQNMDEITVLPSGLTGAVKLMAVDAGH